VSANPRHACRGCGKIQRFLYCSDKCWLAANALAANALTPGDPRGPCAGGCGTPAIDGKATCGEVACNLRASQQRIREFHQKKGA